MCFDIEHKYMIIIPQFCNAKFTVHISEWNVGLNSERY